MSKILACSTRLVAACTMAWMILGCSGSGPDGPADPRGELAIRVVATTGMIGDAAREIGGDHVVVETLMGPGVDPHLYKASEGDVQRLSSADLILYNGLHLEGKMGDILVKLASRRPVVAVGTAVPESALREPPEFAGQYDPHIWFDVSLWKQTIDPIADAMAELRPQFAADFQANAAELQSRLDTLDRWIQLQVETIPDRFRILVTAHDAFGYFGRRYEMRVVGLQGLSTLSEAGLKDMERVVDIVVETKLPAVFIESSVPRRAIEAVQAACRSRGHEVSIGGELFSDALGAPGTPEGTYEGMVRHNVTAIVRALGGEATR